MGRILSRTLRRTEAPAEGSSSNGKGLSRPGYAGGPRPYCEAMLQAVYVSNEDIDEQTCAAIASRIKLDGRLFSAAIDSGAADERMTASARRAFERGALASRLFLSEIGRSGATIVSCCGSTTSPGKAVAKSGHAVCCNCMSPFVDLCRLARRTKVVSYPRCCGRVGRATSTALVDPLLPKNISTYDPSTAP